MWRASDWRDRFDMRESQHIEYKESWRDEYLKWVCAFANADGGLLVIGRNDKGAVVGIRDAKKLLEDCWLMYSSVPGTSNPGVEALRRSTVSAGSTTPQRLYLTTPWPG
jgi:hypothetical protein